MRTISRRSNESTPRHLSIWRSSPDSYLLFLIRAQRRLPQVANSRSAASASVFASRCALFACRHGSCPSSEPCPRLLSLFDLGEMRNVSRGSDFGGFQLNGLNGFHSKIQKKRCTCRSWTLSIHLCNINHSLKWMESSCGQAQDSAMDYIGCLGYCDIDRTLLRLHNLYAIDAWELPYHLPNWANTPWVSSTQPARLSILAQYRKNGGPFRSEIFV